jgi:hypothetical protein
MPDSDREPQCGFANISLDPDSAWTNKCKRTGLYMERPDDFDPPLDPGIRDAVLVLRENGVETFESCQGGPGHTYPVPTIRFYGGQADGFWALGIALQNGMRVSDLRRVWSVIDGEPVGPDWELTFYPEPTGESRSVPCTGRKDAFLPDLSGSSRAQCCCQCGTSRCCGERRI